MTAPKRIQLSRAKGWRKPEGAIVVSRPSKWGNPFHIGTFREGKIRYWSVDTFGGFQSYIPDIWLAHSLSVDEYRDWLRLDTLNPRYWHHDLITQHDLIKTALKAGELRDRSLCCWCPLNRPCHVDVLLKLANSPIPIAAEAS